MNYNFTLLKSHFAMYKSIKHPQKPQSTRIMQSQPLKSTIEKSPIEF